MRLKLSVELTAADLLAADEQRATIFAVGVCRPGSDAVYGNVALMNPLRAEELLLALIENRVVIIPRST